MSFIVSSLTTLISIAIYLNTVKIADERNRLAVRTVVLLVGAIAAIASILKTLAIIPPGTVGVVNLFGQVSPTPLEPGIHLLNPFAEVVKFSTRIRDIKENVDTISREGLNLNMDVSLEYKLDPQKAAAVYQTIGTDETEILVSRFRSTIRAITANYPASNVYSTKRQEITQRLNRELRQQLPPLGFVVEETLLRKVQMPENLQAAIQQKLQAEQESQQMTFVLQKEREEAERKQIEARGIADFQKTVSQSLNSQILQMRAIEATEKLARSNNTKVVVMSGGDRGAPLILQPDSASVRP
jgi:regulator of protease activity HflC (stomatin/prohibitin superfamily)